MISARQVAGAFLRRRKNAGKVQLQKWVVEFVERRYRETSIWPIEEDVYKEKYGPVIAEAGRILDLKHRAILTPLSAELERLVAVIIRDLDKIGAGEALSNWSHQVKVYWRNGQMHQPIDRKLMLHQDDFMRGMQMLAQLLQSAR